MGSQELIRIEHGHLEIILNGTNHVRGTAVNEEMERLKIWNKEGEPHIIRSSYMTGPLHFTVLVNARKSWILPSVLPLGLKYMFLEVWLGLLNMT